MNEKGVVTTCHEMKRRFVLGEINSSRFGYPTQQAQYMKDLLESGDYGLEYKAIQLHQRRYPHWASLPHNTLWTIVQFRLHKSEFEKIYTNQEESWKRLTDGTYKLIDAANNLDADPTRDPNISEVISACRGGKFNPIGITLHSQKGDDRYRVVEGSARLISLYICCINARLSQICTEEIELILGVSERCWKVFPPRGY